MASCALTGHRALRKDFSAEELENRLEEFIENGTDTFYCGMAVGFDLVCAQIILRLREKYAVKLIACIPYPGQSAKFSAAWRKIYDECVARADQKVTVSPEYSGFCMSARNQYMVNRADYVYAYLYDAKGGTANTVRYAQEKGKRVLRYGQPILPCQMNFL